jgi:beta-galactosidase
VELSSGPSVGLQYVDEVHKYYDALFQLNIQTDMVPEDADFSQYDLVIAPVLYMIKPGFAQKIESFVQAGGSFLTTFFSGIVNENDLVTLGGYPGELRSVLGIWSEEIDALFPDQSNEVVIKAQNGALKASYTCGLLCDLIHPEGAEVIAEYGQDFYKGIPAITKNHFGAGQAWYVATSPEPALLQDLLSNICLDKNIQPLLKTPHGVEASQRSKDGKSFLFLLNHNAEEAVVDTGLSKVEDLLTGELLTGSIRLSAKGVRIIAV